MADPYDRRTRLDQDGPTGAKVRTGLRRYVFGSYFVPVVLFAILAGGALAYYKARPAELRPLETSDEMRPQGTSGERTTVDKLPGGHNPVPTFASPRDEMLYRDGKPITKLHDVVKEESRATDGRRVEIDSVEVERVDGPTTFWVRDGGTRVPVVVVQGSADVRRGQKVRVVGSVERTGDDVRIRATRVEAVG